MAVRLDELVGLIETLWWRWAEAGADMAEDQWTLPTRLGGWDVAALFAHATIWPVALAEVATFRVDAPPRHRAGAQLLAAFNAPGGLADGAATQVAQVARDDAATTAPADLVARFADVAPAAVAALRDTPSGAVVEHPSGGTITLAGVCEVALVEAVVHLLDLRVAVVDGGAADLPDVPDDAIVATRDVLAAIPDPVRFIEAATGRTTDPVLPVLR